MNGPNNMIWCPICEAIKPLVIDDLPGLDVTGKFDNARDLICGKCHLVIATTYSPCNSENCSDPK